MNQVSEKVVRRFLINLFLDSIKMKGFNAEDVPDNFDLLREGIIDSLGLIEIISALEKEFGIKIDFGDLDAEDLVKIGPFSRYIESKSK